MMWPILCRVSPTALVKLFSGRQIWYHLLFSLIVNWIVAPLIMLALAWAFLPDKVELREGLILVGLARCIAMVLVWTDIAGGDSDCSCPSVLSSRNAKADLQTSSPTDCAVLVAFNSLLQIVLFAPLAILYVRVIGGSSSSAFSVSYEVVARSVAAFLGQFSL